jgi:alpha-glucosidase
MQHTNERPLTDVRVHLYRASGAFEAAFTLYEDDGVTLDYETGQFLRTRIGYEGTGTVDRVAIARVEGVKAPTPGRTWTLELHGVGSADSVTMNGAVLPGAPSLAALESMVSGWTISQQRVVVRVPDSSNPILVEAFHGSQQ